MKPKKTLVAKLYTDVSELSDAVIDLQKAFMRVAAGDSRIEFEVLVENEATDNAIADRLLNLVRSEFKERDADAGEKHDEAKTDMESRE